MRRLYVIQLRSALMLFAFITWVALTGTPVFAQVTPAGEDQHQSASILGPLVNQSPELRIGQNIGADISKGQTHLYRVYLASSQFVQLRINRYLGDIAVRIVAPDSQQLMRLDSTMSLLSANSISWIAATNGAYTIELTIPIQGLQQAKYDLSLADTHAATEHDKIQCQATSLLLEAKRLQKLGEAEQLRSALAKLQQATGLLESIDERGDRALTITEIGATYLLLADYGKATEFLQHSRSLWQSADDPNGLAVATDLIGQAQNWSGHNKDAIESFENALKIWRGMDYRRGEGATLDNLGKTYFDLRRNREALSCLLRALELSETEGDITTESDALNTIGLVYDATSDVDKAAEYWNRALELFKAMDDARGQGTLINNLGLTYRARGEVTKSLEYYNRALSLWRTLGDRRGEAYTLQNLGSTFLSLGDYDKSIEYFREASELRKEMGDPQEAISLLGIAATYNKVGDHSKATEYCSRALKISKTSGDRESETSALLTSASAYFSMGKTRRALNTYELALSKAKSIRYRVGEIRTLLEIGTLQSHVGETARAQIKFHQALSAAIAIGDYESQAAALFGLARLDADAGHLKQALAYVSQAIGFAEEFRTRIPPDEFRSTYFGTVEQYYELCVDIHMQLRKRFPREGHDLLAFEVSERARARSLLDLLKEARADIREGADRKLVERERSLQQLLNAKAERHMRLLAEKNTEEAGEVGKQIDALTTELQQVRTDIRDKSPRYAALTQPQVLRAKEVQRLLDPDSLLLEYFLGDRRSYVWAIDSDSVTAYKLPRRTEIEAIAKRLYALLSTSNSTAGKVKTEVASVLGRILMGPLAEQVGRKRLIIVAHGALQYLPFAALPEPANRDEKSGPPYAYRSLIVDHEIVSLPSASTLEVLRQGMNGRKPPTKMVAVFADPVFSSDDPRVKQVQARTDDDHRRHEQPTDATTMVSQNFLLQRSGEESGILSFDRLPFSRREADGIIGFIHDDGEALKALDFQANRATATGEEVGRYRIVHFASHALLNARHPELSGVVLSLVDEQGRPQDGFLRAHDIYNLNLSAELVVLSACQTALGKEVKGEGLVGLTRGFMYAGAPRVVASLWKVPDNATAELMKQFYKGLLQENLRPAAALRSAQIAIQKEQQWSEPYYWAGFVLQGEWK